MSLPVAAMKMTKERKTDRGSQASQTLSQIIKNNLGEFGLAELQQRHRSQLGTQISAFGVESNTYFLSLFFRINTKNLKHNRSKYMTILK